MGGFYGSVQIRTDDRLKVVRAAELATTKAGIRCLIGPLIDGWVGVYPEGAGQDQAIGRAIARDMGGDVLQAAVHDDDLMVYWLWHDSELTDAYWSRPGYFNEADREEQVQMAGDPQAFGDLLAGRERAMVDILHRRRTDLQFESARLQEFAQFLGIRNAVTSYEYLKAGERAGIEGWDQFDEVPAEAVAAEQALARARRQEIELGKQQLRDQWLLLADVVEENLVPRACIANGGLLVAWEGFGRGEARQEFYRPPWGEAEPGEIETGGVVNSLAADAKGRRVAMALGNRVVVWDAAGWQPVLELVESEWAVQVALSADAKLVAYACRTGVFVHDIDTGKRITALSTHESPALAFHPSGEWLMSAGTALWIARVNDTEPWRELYPGGQAPLPDNLANAVKKEMGRVDLDAMESKWRSAIGAAVEKMAAAGQKNAATGQLIEKMHQQMEKQLGQMRANLANLKAGNIPAPRAGIERVLCAGFTADGRHLWCGTDRGLHVYDWQAVLSTPNNSAMPNPGFSHAPVLISASGSAPAMIYAAAQMPARQSLLFGGYAGLVCELNLESDEVRDLVAPPDGGAIISIVPSSDGAVVGVSSRPALGANGVKEDQLAIWEIWSCAALMKASR